MAAAEVTTLVIEKGTYFEATFTLFDPDQSTAVLSGLTTNTQKRQHMKNLVRQLQPERELLDYL
jgi:hypothetical protein